MKLGIKTYPCSRCGAPVAPNAPHWRDDGGYQHLECIEWSKRAFPFEGDILWLEQRYRELMLKLAVVTRTGRWLRAAIKRWPDGAARAVAEWPAKRHGVETALSPPQSKGRREER